MKLISCPFLAIYLLCFSEVVFAQVSCPPGMMPYGTAQDISVCGPIPGQQQQTSSPKAPPMKWASKWGALATDVEAGSIGSSHGIDDRNEAESLALIDCQKKGGRKCKIETSYVNGCGAIIAGDRLHNSVSGPTLDEAINKGMSACNKNDSNCEVIYSSCSPSQRIQ